jgi:hypothetical protein
MSRKRRQKQKRPLNLGESGKKFPRLDPELCKSFQALAEIVLGGLQEVDPDVGYNEAGVAKLEDKIELLVEDGTQEAMRFVAAGAFLGEAVIARTGGYWCWGPKVREPLELTHRGKSLDLARVGVAYDLRGQEDEAYALPFIRVSKRLDFGKEFPLTDWYALTSPDFQSLPPGFDLYELLPELQEAIRLFGTEAIFLSDLKDPTDQELLEIMTADQRMTELFLAGQRLVSLPLPLQVIVLPTMKEFVAKTPAGHFAVVVSRKETFSYVYLPREGQLLPTS